MSLSASLNKILIELGEALPPRRWIDIALALLVTLSAVLIARKFPAIIERCERMLSGFSKRRAICICICAILPLAVRAGMLPWVPTPEPSIHDEFSHLLLADTIASGKLTNPQHPFWQHFETIYVLHTPTYASVYPPAQGIVLGITQRIAGCPWLGVWISVAAMSAAICWALYGWIPPQWAFLGGLSSGLIYGVSTYWMNSYWGGAVSATGGAIALGALGRLRYGLHPLYSILLAGGTALALFSRPYESVCFGLAASVVMLGLARKRGWSPGAFFRLFIVPGAVVAFAAFAFMAYYNRTVTGSALEMPYQADQKIHGVPQSLLWQHILKAGPFRFKDIEDCYLWQLDKRLEMASLKMFPLRTLFKIFVVWRFYIGYWFAIPLIALILLRKPGPVLLVAALLIFGVFMSIFYTYFLPHYFALYTAAIVLLAIEGLRQIYISERWSTLQRFAIVVFTLASALLTSLDLIGPYATPISKGGERAQIASFLKSQPGSHLVFVHYEPNHSFYDEWIYNAADIDHAPIIWARDLTAAENDGLIRHLPGRSVWLVEGREQNSQIHPYTSSDASPESMR